MASNNSVQLPDDIFDTRRLRLLVAVDESGSLTAAARKLCLTQSAVSHSLRKLEEDAGTQLVERNERGAALTAAGECLARHAAAILERMGAAREELFRLKNWGSDRLRVGASSTACQYLLPRVLQAFRRARPKCRVEISTGDTAQRLDALRSGRIDLAIITHSGLDDPQVESRELIEENLCLVAPAADPGTRAWIQYSGGSSYATDARRMLEGIFGSRQAPAMEVESLEAIRSLVVLGLGCAVLPGWLVREDIEAGRLVMPDCPVPPVRRVWAVVVRKGRQLTAAESEWVRQCSDPAMLEVLRGEQRG